MIFYHCILLEKRNKDITAVAWPVSSFHPKHLNRHLFNNQEVPVWWQVVSSGSFPLQNLYFLLQTCTVATKDITNFDKFWSGKLWGIGKGSLNWFYCKSFCIFVGETGAMWDTGL
jgi:hypothetical protein